MRSFPNPQWLWQHRRTLPSILSEAGRLLSEITGELEHRGWSDRDIFAVQLAVEEALVNAIKHGNRSDPGKTVTVSCWLSEDLFRIEIEDQGDGFDPATVPDPTSPERLEEPTGRGIMLMRTFMTKVTYNAKGNAVVLEKRRSTSDQ